MQQIEELLWAGDEDRFLIVFTMTLATPRLSKREAENELLEEMLRRDDELRQSLEKEVQKPRAEADEGEVHFEIVDLSYQRGSIELMVVLGVVYAAIKDYDSVRKSLERLMDDMVSVIRHVLKLKNPIHGTVPGTETWDVKHEIRRMSVTDRDKATRGQPREHVAEAAPRKAAELTHVAQRPARWDASRWAILYLVASNILLMTLLGLLLITMTT